MKHTLPWLWTLLFPNLVLDEEIMETVVVNYLQQ